LLLAHHRPPAPSQRGSSLRQLSRFSHWALPTAVGLCRLWHAGSPARVQVIHPSSPPAKAASSTVVAPIFAPSRILNAALWPSQAPW